ncbi:hypothetical protein K1T71_007962 [Dendrolimus kikuchii]|uniref:Uncharacterized protein n=1 Tax=Dendrolimus kikuchii TaxID=765133 RepID=A0ACC1CYP6_9NEOP|nr:hypothetical protein K1T71_007962 [Dendrolimus kikuchii]
MDVFNALIVIDTGLWERPSVIVEILYIFFVCFGKHKNVKCQCVLLKFYLAYRQLIRFHYLVLSFVYVFVCIHTSESWGDLELNFSKCELFINENCDYLISELINLAPNLKIVSKKNLTLLGAPVFEESFNSFFDDKIQNFTHKVDNLKIISKHSAYFIIRHCLFVPNFMYVLRCSPLWRHSNILNVLDSTIRQSLTSILNLPFDFEDRTWTQATLPIRLGGLGIRKISDVALPAFLSSVYSTVDLIGKLINPSLSDFEVPYLAEARNAWSLACPSQNYPVEPKSQKLWDGPLSKLVYKNLLSTSVNEAERARLLAVSKWESGLWLQALPSSNLGTLLDDTTFRIAASIRLGAPTVVPHHCQCGDKVGGSGHHGLSCVRSAGRIPRHAALNDIIRRALVTTGTPAILEPNGLCRDDGKRPDGMSLVPWKMGRPLVWDATCVDTLAASHLPDTAVVAGAAAARQEDLKRRKYASVGSGYIFAAFGVETLGPWGPEAHRLYRDLSKRLIDVSRNQNAGLYFGQRISVAIQRGNAASVSSDTSYLTSEAKARPPPPAPKADALAERLRGLLDTEDVGISRPMKTIGVIVSGLDDCTTAGEVETAIARVADCPVDHIRSNGIRLGPDGLGTTVATCPVAAAKKLEGRKLLVGWASAAVKPLPVKAQRCYRCHVEGHVVARCTSEVDRSGLCYRCGQVGHRAATCRASPHCSVCEAAGRSAKHRLGSGPCEARPTKKRQKKKAATSMPVQPQPQPQEPREEAVEGNKTN